jgi:hypothetical protein
MPFAVVDAIAAGPFHPVAVGLGPAVVTVFVFGVASRRVDASAASSSTPRVVSRRVTKLTTDACCVA